jgi:C1A family cysteine protease/PKD repeat protein
MKKILLHLILFCMLPVSLHAQEGTGSPYNSPNKSSSPDPGYTLGYKPAPFTLRQLQRPSADARYKSSSALPSVFDLRSLGRVTPARDQGGGNYGGNCTSFSSIGSIESRWLSMGFPETDLSEQNMAACNGFDEENWGFGQGANQFVCSAYLTRFDGPVSEEDDPYNLILHFCRSDIVELSPVALVPESRWLPVRDFELLKHTVYNYGAVYAGIHWDVTRASFNADSNTYYYFGLEPANHAILVCGWDDTKVTAGGTGAWICKNSWGTGWGENGFFYISYQDSRFAGDEVAFFPVRWEKDEVDTSYVWDELGFTAKLPAQNASKVSELAMYVAPSRQLITHVGVAVPDPETVLDFHVYDDFIGDKLSKLLGSREGIYVEIPGIYTFELPVTVEGDFYIEVTREIGDADINHAIETFDEGFSDPLIEPDVNWTRREGTEAWIPTDLAGMGLDFNLTIRAYAVYNPAPVALFMADKKEACLGSEVTYTYLENNPASTFEWDFGEGATPAAANTQGPHQVTYSSEGTKTVSLLVTGPGGTDTVIRHDYIDVVPAIRVNILNTSLTFQQGKTVEVSAYGADSYQWSPSNMVDNPGVQTVMATPPFIGEHTLYVTGTQGSCTATDSIKFITTPKPPNDDMCDARLMNPGGWIGNFSNEFATAEEGEPAPDDINCYTPMTWCVDDWGPTVTNSLWFCFYGAETGIASIRTSGFDNQIAVYRADTCTEITKESLIAANDDYSQNPEVLPATLDAVSVEPGKKYFLQVDGSFGGAIGTFSLLYYAYPTGIAEPGIFDRDALSLTVYPNPGKDVFNLELENARSGEIDILLFDMSGKLLQSKSFRGVPGELFTRFDLGSQPAGIYHLRVIDGDRILDRKLVKE